LSSISPNGENLKIIKLKDFIDYADNKLNQALSTDKDFKSDVTNEGLLERKYLNLRKKL